MLGAGAGLRDGRAMSDPNSGPFFTAAQRRIVGFALTLLALLGSAALLIGSLMVLGQLLARFSSVIWPLAIAGVLALILRPLVELLSYPGQVLPNQKA